MAARLMRRILVDAARATRLPEARRRCRDACRSTKRSSCPASPVEDFVALDDALNALAAVDARKSQVVEMRFFGGMSIEETAEALHVSRDTVKRDWRLAKPGCCASWVAATCDEA